MMGRVLVPKRTMKKVLSNPSQDDMADFVYYSAMASTGNILKSLQVKREFLALANNHFAHTKEPNSVSPLAEKAFSTYLKIGHYVH